MTALRVFQTSQLLLILCTGLAQSATVRNYFAIGSNMVPSTMTSLRNLSPSSATAAVLPDYRLAFDIEGPSWLEPSAASVRYSPGKVVHGVLYTLDKESDFQSLSSSEGVPFAYRWQACNVIPYNGDGGDAGAKAVDRWRESIVTNSRDNGDIKLAVPAVVLMKSSRPQMWPFSIDDNTKKGDIPTSQSYLGILQRGASMWKMDRSYQTELSNVETAPGTVGVSGISLATAELLNPREDMDLLPKET